MEIVLNSIYIGCNENYDNEIIPVKHSESLFKELNYVSDRILKLQDPTDSDINGIVASITESMNRFNKKVNDDNKCKLYSALDSISIYSFAKNKKIYIFYSTNNNLDKEVDGYTVDMIKDHIEQMLSSDINLLGQFNTFGIITIVDITIAIWPKSDPVINVIYEDELEDD